MTKLRVCGHRILVKVDNELALEAYKASDLQPGEVLVNNEVQTASGMHIRYVKIDMDKEKRGAETGVVLQVGESAYKDFGTEPWCSVGDRVFFVRYEGREIKSEEIGEPKGISYRVLNDEDVVARLSNNSEA